MTEGKIIALVDEIDNVSGMDFWWDSPLLNAAAKVHDARVVASLVRRHGCLSNKEAYSAHVLRTTIKSIDGPDFKFLWEIIDGESDFQRLVEGLKDPFYLLWSAVMVLGEVGGARVMQTAALKIGIGDSIRDYVLVRLLAHLSYRYNNIAFESPSDMNFPAFDLKGNKLPNVQFDQNSTPVQFEKRKRTEANEFFTPLDAQIMKALLLRVTSLPDSIFYTPKKDLILDLGGVPVQ